MPQRRRCGRNSFRFRSAGSDCRCDTTLLCPGRGDRAGETCYRLGVGARLLQLLARGVIKTLQDHSSTFRPNPLEYPKQLPRVVPYPRVGVAQRLLDDLLYEIDPAGRLN